MLWAYKLLLIVALKRKTISLEYRYDICFKQFIMGEQAAVAWGIESMSRILYE